MAAAALAPLLITGCSSSDDTSTAPTSDPGGSTSAVALPVARTEVAGAAFEGMTVVAGGLTADGAASDRVDLYDPATDAWRPGPSLPAPLHHVGLAALGDRLWLAGGYATGPGGPWQAQDRVYSLGPDETGWRDEPSMLRPRGALTLVAGDDRLVAIGDVSQGVTGTTEVFVPGEGAWRAGPDLAQPREHLGGAASGGRVYAIGGRVGSLESNLATVESWDPTRPEGWRPEPRLNDPRGGTAAAAVGERICVAGGEEVGGTIGSVECLGDGGWERVGRLSTPRHGVAVAGLEGLLHVVGGGPTPGLSVSGAHEVFRVA